MRLGDYGRVGSEDILYDKQGKYVSLNSRHPRGIILGNDGATEGFQDNWYLRFIVIHTFP